jgi:two-component system, cell cycle response regulator
MAVPGDNFKKGDANLWWRSSLDAEGRMFGYILVVDDVMTNAILLEARLVAAGLNVITAFSGSDCLAKVEQQIPDLILLDVMMPGMDGFEVCRRIKGNPKTAHIPVVMVSALDHSAARMAGKEAGADDFLTKPVTEAILSSCVQKFSRARGTSIG